MRVRRADRLMRNASVLAVISGSAIDVVVSGAAHALVAVPAPIVGAFGLAGMGIALARARTRRPAMAAFVAGLALGFPLPQSPPAGQIVTRAAGMPHAGDLFALLERVDSDPRALIGRSVAVSGDWTPRDAARSASVSRRIMACCAADAVDVGFDVLPLHAATINAGAEVCVAGVLAARLMDGELRYQIVHAIVREHACRR